MRPWWERFEEGFVRTWIGLGNAALVILMVTGPWLPLAGEHMGWVSVPALRGFHLTAGLVLVVAVSLRLGRAGLRFVRLLRRRRGLTVGDLVSGLRALWTGAGLLAAAYWVTVALLILSGLEQTAQMRYAAHLLPVFSPLVWDALHWVTPLYLYAIVVLMTFNWTKAAARRVLDYLFAP